MKNKKILVLGGCGFIGSHLSEKLCQNNKVICYDKFLFGNKIQKNSKNLIIVKEDVLNYKSLLKYSKNVDTIYHLAAIVGVDAVGEDHIMCMEEENACIRNIFKAMRVNNVKNLIKSFLYRHLEQALKH